MKLKDVEYLHEWQWHWGSDRCSSSDIEKRSEMYDVYKYKWDIYNVYSEATESDHDDEHNKYDENNEIKALNDEHIYR